MDQIRSVAVKNLMLDRNERERRNSEEHYVDWLPRTPSSSATNSSSGVDWLEKNKQKCQLCTQGGPCCNRSFNHPCSSDCTCKLVETWAKLTLTDDQRRVFFIILSLLVKCLNVQWIFRVRLWESSMKRSVPQLLKYLMMYSTSTLGEKQICQRSKIVDAGIPQ